jgi:hypothetical protein
MLAESNYGETDMAMNSARFHGDDTLLVKFFKHPKVNAEETKKAGRPIFEEVAFIQIMMPGNKDHIVVRPARDMDKRRFAEHWRKYEAREDQDAVVGTLLEEWAGITRSQCEELKYLNIKTVEQLAAVTDSNAQGIMGIGFLKEKANKYLTDTAGNATAEALSDLQSKYEALVAQMAGTTVAELPKPKRKRRSSAQVKLDNEAAAAAIAHKDELGELVNPTE